MPALPAYVRYWADRMWADLPEKTTPIIASALKHWDDWHKLTRDRIEEIASALATSDANDAKRMSTIETNKADKSTTITAGTGLTGGGSLAANRTLSVQYGTTSTTAARGDDTRVVNALAKPVSAAIARADLLVGLATGLLDRLPIGSNGLSLIADSTVPLGVRWGTPSMDGLTWSAWTTIPLASGCTVPSGGTAPQARLRGEEVQLRGEVINSAISSSYVLIGTLPSAFLPSRPRQAGVGIALDNTGKPYLYNQSYVLAGVWVNANGDIYVYDPVRNGLISQRTVTLSSAQFVTT